MADKVNSIEEVMQVMGNRFNPEAAAGVDAVFQFDLSGDKGGKYWIKVVNQQYEVGQGESDSPSITILSTAEDYLKMINGEIAPMTAFMQGKVKVKGNMGLAMKLQSIFRL